MLLQILTRAVAAVIAMFSTNVADTPAGSQDNY
jgi:hypothetical protein